MKKGNLTGWKDVFTFTLIQTLKSKAFIISYVIIIMLMFVSMPVTRMITDRGLADANGPSPVKKVYVNNETSLPHMDFSEGPIVFESIKEDYDIIAKRVEENEKDSIILTILESNEEYTLNFIKSSKSKIKNGSLQLLADAVSAQFETLKIDKMGIKSNQFSMINSEVKTKVSTADVNGIENIDTSISTSQYWFIYGLLFVVMMVNMLASTQIATSIVTEKSTRVIEYLLTSVKPLALIVGKILAMLTASLLHVISMVVVLFISNMFSEIVSSVNGESVLSQYLPKEIFQNLNIINILLCFILLALGMIFYAGLAGLAGATVSRLEDINEGLTIFTFISLAGVYIAIGAAGMLMGKGMNWYVIFSFLFPLSSPFLLPGAILIGKVSLPIAVASIVIIVIFIILLFKFVAKIYETLILHNGNQIKIKQLIKISKSV